MSGAGPEAPDRVERLRRASAPVVALLAAALGLTCLLGMPFAFATLAELAAIDSRFVGWIGVGVLVSVGTAATSLLALDRVGAGPPLALGATAGVVALALGHHILGRHQLTFAIVVAGFAVGALLGGVVGMTSALPGRWARPAAAAWAVSLLAVWPVLVRLSPRGRPTSPSVVVHPAAWMLVVATVAILGWSVLTMLVEPVRPPRPRLPSSAESWWALLLVCAVVLLLTTMLGFDPQISLVWLRPIVILATAALGVGWALIVLVLATASRLAFVGATVVAGLVPTTVTLAVAVVNQPAGGVSVSVVMALGAATVAGGVVGSRGRSAAVPFGLAVTALAAVAGWVMSDSPWLMLGAVAPLLAAAAVVLVGSLQLVVTDPEASRLIGFAVICAVVVGGVVAVPLSWAMLGDVPTGLADIRAAGRLYAGLTVAASSLAAAWTWVLRRRLLSTTSRARSSSAFAHFPGAVLEDSSRW